MNVSFEMNEIVNGYRIHTRNGLNRYTAENKDNILIFETDAGAGRNYCKILRYTNKITNRSYLSPRYFLKFVPVVQEFSNVLYQRYLQKNR